MKNFNLYSLSKYLKPRCPHCFKLLVKSDERRYETLTEHVSNPNMKNHPARPTMTCSCELGKFGYWDWNGNGFYITGDYREFHKKFPLDKSFAYHAGIFSFGWFHSVEISFTKKVRSVQKFLKIGKDNA